MGKGQSKPVNPQTQSTNNNNVNSTIVDVEETPFISYLEAIILVLVIIVTCFIIKKIIKNYKKNLVKEIVTRSMADLAEAV